jgi:NADH-dependent peroxiredoxin subunit F
MDTAIFEVIIIGGGPSGVAAAVYCARKKLKTLLIAESFGGQSIVSSDIENWIGEVHISGLDLAKKLEAHVRAYPEVIEIKSPEKATNVRNIACSGDGENRICDFEVTTDKSTYTGKTVIVASGASRRKLGIPGEDTFGGKGVAFCSTCDAPVFKDKKVVVIGGGNAGLEGVVDLFPYATEVYLMDAGPELRGDPATVDEVKKNPKLKEIILNAKPKEIIGETLVTGLKYEVGGEEKLLEVGGVFVEIGSVPNSQMVKDLVQVDEHGQVIMNFQHARTSHPGVFAAGDVTNDPYKQNNISVGDGVRAALSAYAYLQNRAKVSPAEEKPHGA